MQDDGNLVLYDTSNQARWESGTSGNPGAYLVMQNDGNVVVYRAGSTSPTSDNALWETATSVLLSLLTVVEPDAMLDVGDANLTYLSSDMCYAPNAGPGGLLNVPYTEQGSRTSVSPGGCGRNPVTVNATITASWNGDLDGTWTWQDLQAGFASALLAAMQAASKPYANYSYTEVPIGKTGEVACMDPQFLDWGHYIPAKIRVTANNNSDSSQVGQVTLTYSTDQSGGDGGDVCDAIEAGDGVLAIFPPTAELAAIVGAVTGVACDIING
jgi:hypothetical protein